MDPCEFTSLSNELFVQHVDVCIILYTFPRAVAMSSLQDSKAHFLARAAEYQVPEDFVRNLTANGVSTMAQLAFAIGRPGQEISDADFDTFITTVNAGTPLTIGGTASMRRLHFESEIILTASLKVSIVNSLPLIRLHRSQHPLLKEMQG